MFRDTTQPLRYGRGLSAALKDEPARSSQQGWKGMAVRTSGVLGVLAALSVSLVAAGCSPPSQAESEEASPAAAAQHAEPEGRVAPEEAAEAAPREPAWWAVMPGLYGPPMLTVQNLITARPCSTAMAELLNLQMAAEQNCIQAGSFVSILDIPNVKLGPAANPFLQSGAASALREAAATRPDKPFAINSTWRSTLQQHILRHWKGRCGIRVVAKPGSSLHESGLALDVPLETTDLFRRALKREGFVWFCDRTNRGRLRRCKDQPHYDFKGQDLSSSNVLAFQRLWNHSYAEDALPLTGHYDEATAARMNKAPLLGFPAGTTCDATAFLAAHQPRAAAAMEEAAEGGEHGEDTP